MEKKLNDAVESFRSLIEKEDLLARVIEFFPYPIQIFSHDGTSMMINKAAARIMGIKSAEDHVGIYNVFRDPIVKLLGFMNQLKEVLKGKTITLTDFYAPYEGVYRYVHASDKDINSIRADITCFPLTDSAGEVVCFVAMFMIKNIYRGKEEVTLGRQYIETHWREPFDIEKTAKAACLSQVHFTRLFKKHIGITPHKYYINYRISRLMEKLQDSNLSIAEAFAACNIEYNGHSARVFRNKTGLSPSAYRRIKSNHN
jgi:AraC family transcriptional regulator